MRRIISLLGMLCLVVASGCGDDTTYDCETRADCANNGECVEGVCDCDTGYAGIHCSTCNIAGGYISDGAGDCIPAQCEDLDGDTFDGHDEALCPLGADHCDDDPNNHTVGGCDNCVDGDGDGFGTSCDLGPDCDDTDPTIHEGCNACIDNDNDGHGVNCSDGPDCNDADPSVHRGCYEVWYWGDFDTDGEFEVAKQFYPGAERTLLDLTGIDTSQPLGGVHVSPDGSAIAVAAIADTGFAVLNLYSADATTFAATLVATTSATEVITSPQLSADGQQVAFLWNTGTGAMRLWVVSASGGTPKLLSPDPGCATCDVTYFRWAPYSGGNTHIAFVGDVDTDGYNALWGVSVNATAPMADEIVSTAEATTLGVDPLLDFDDANRVYFMSDFEVMGTRRLYRANLDGSNRAQVADTALPNGGAGEASVGSFGLNDGGTRLAISADAPSVGLYQVYLIALDGSHPPDRVSNVAVNPPAPGSYFGPSFVHPIVWAPDEEHLVVVADWATDASDLDDAFSLYVLPTLNNGGVRLLGSPNDASRQVLQVDFAPNSEQVWARGDMSTDDNAELYLTENLFTVVTDPTSIRAEDVPTGGDVYGFQIVLSP